MATANEIPVMWDLAIFGSFFILGFLGVCLFRGNGQGLLFAQMVESCHEG